MAKKPKPEGGAATDARGVDLAEVRRLLAFMQENGLEEFEYERRGVHIRLKRASTHPAALHRPAGTAETAGANPATPPAASTGGHERVREAAHGEDVHVIKSPIVGTFYSAPSPEAEPFVVVGSRVEIGQVLCIIEAMKLMNEIESDATGEVVQVFVESGHPVEYGAELFGIRVQGKK